MAVTDLLLAANYLPDKIIYRASKTISVPAATTIGDYLEFSFAHGLPFIPLIIGSYSDDGFTTSYDFGMGPYGTVALFAGEGYQCMAHAWADATNITVRAQSFDVARTLVCHFVGLFPVPTSLAEYDIDVPPVQDPLLIDTDLNYLKHAYHTSYNVNVNGSGSWQNFLLTNNLTYPLAMMPFILEDGRMSYGNTYNSITIGGVEVSFLSKPGELTLGFKSTSPKTIGLQLKAYRDDPN